MTAAASAIHAFNRFEIKYVASFAQVERLRVELDRAMAPDPHAGADGYRVESVYYDSPALRFYWEKVDGLRFRRKLRLRRYGSGPAPSHSPVFVEIKQRVNRVTQKRRIDLPYADAVRLCAGQAVALPRSASVAQTRLVDEIVELCAVERLRPMVTTCYQRQAYVGRHSDLGLRVTIDRRLRGRDRDFELGAASTDRLTLPPSLAVVEVKADHRVPYWLTDLTGRHDLTVVRLSKYCRSVEAFGLVPRAAHAPSGQDFFDDPDLSGGQRGLGGQSGGGQGPRDDQEASSAVPSAWPSAVPTDFQSHDTASD
ncbi:MAG: polyphosphate polymerase domain-containing protein [Propionibacteriaceae bacterium]|jgi:hypothetical protein|nr:polyphosphate polymerase domain-containing protein [Propionibacteriaceae bacterium]